MQEEQRNLILAIVLSITIIVGFEIALPGSGMFGGPQQQEATTEPGSETPSTTPTPSAPGQATPAPAPSAAPDAVPDRSAAVAADPRVEIKTPRVNGSIALTGGRLDDLTLLDYHETVDPASPNIELLSPRGAPKPYFVEFGWTVAGDAASQPRLPDTDTTWTADGTVLTPGTPVTLTWDNGAGLRFTRVFAVDGDYMFTVTQRVENTGDVPVTLYPYGLIRRVGTPPVSDFWFTQEGPLGVFNGTLDEIDYDDLQDDGAIEKRGTVSWTGITDKYWLVALIPDQTAQIKTLLRHIPKQDSYQVDYLYDEGLTVAPGTTAEVADKVFAGAKVVRIIDQYEEDFGLTLFDRAVGFAFLFFLAKPLFYLLEIINGWVGNFGVAIILLTVLIKILFFPLANKSYRSMGKMKRVQPEIMKLRERFGEDKQRLNQEMMALYKKEKINPASGCLPILIQIPVFFALYEVLFVTIEMRHAPFFGWIQDLSAPDPTTVFNLFGLIPFTPPEFLLIGVWPLLMGISMFLQFKLNPTPPDPIQAKIFMFMPIVFTFLLARFPSGLVIYWTCNNVLSIAQQWFIMRRHGAVTAPAVPAASKAGGSTAKKGGEAAAKKGGEAAPKKGGGARNKRKAASKS